MTAKITLCSCSVCVFVTSSAHVLPGSYLVAHGAGLQYCFMPHNRKGLMCMHQGDALPYQNDPQQAEAPKDGRQRHLAIHRLSWRIINLRAHSFGPCGLCIQEMTSCSACYLQPISQVSHATSVAITVSQDDNLHNKGNNSAREGTPCDCSRFRVETEATLCPLEIRHCDS